MCSAFSRRQRPRGAPSDANNPRSRWDSAPQWSPNGKTLAFVRFDLRTQREAVLTVGIDGTADQRVTPTALNAANPDWSPNGRWIVFTGEPTNGRFSDLFRIRPDGTELRNLTRQGFVGYHYLSASYSPDGTMIATARTPGAGPEHAADVVTVRADGSSIRPVTKTRLWESGADWGTGRSKTRPATRPAVAPPARPTEPGSALRAGRSSRARVAAPDRLASPWSGT